MYSQSLINKVNFYISQLSRKGNTSNGILWSATEKNKHKKTTGDMLVF